MSKIEYFPPGPVAAGFLSSNSFVNGIRGPIGSRKSTACVMKLLRHAGDQPKGKDGRRRSRYAVIRNTYPELRTTTIKTWEQWVPKNIGKWVEQGPPSHRIINQDLDMEIWFVALDRPDDVAKLLSMELTGAWVNEAREVPKAIIDGLTGRVGRFPPVRDGGVNNPQIWLDTNCPDTDHWWYRLAEEERPPGWSFFAQPSARSPEAENLRNLPPGYYERAISGKDEDWTRVYIDGLYGFVREGKPVFPEYKDVLHCRSFELIACIPIRIGLDFGLMPAALFAQRSPLGQWRWHTELCPEDVGVYRFAELIQAHLAEHYRGFEVTQITGDPAGDARSPQDKQERTTFQIIQSLGINAQPASSNDWVKRREAVARPLTRLINGEPGLIIHPQCRMARKGMMGGFSYRRVQVSNQERYEDKPFKNLYSHICDAGQYLHLGGGEWTDMVKKKNEPPIYAPPFEPSDPGMGY